MKKNVLTLFCITLLTLAGFPSCSDKENKGEAIRNPIAANLPGKWTMTKSYEKKDGEWKEVIEPEGSGTTYLFRTDGSMMSAVTYANHDTYLRSLTWEAEDHKNTFKINYKAYPVEYTLMRLTADELEFGYDKATDYATGATQEGEFKWLFRRIDEEQKNFAERLVGRCISARATRRRKASGKRSPTVSLMKGGTNIPSKAPSPPTRVRVARSIPPHRCSGKRMPSPTQSPTSPSTATRCPECASPWRMTARCTCSTP